MTERNVMYESEGYKMFYGTATVAPKSSAIPAFTQTGTWLYNPNYDCWYVNGRSFAAGIVVLPEMEVRR